MRAWWSDVRIQVILSTTSKQDLVTVWILLKLEAIRSYETHANKKVMIDNFRVYYRTRLERTCIILNTTSKASEVTTTKSKGCFLHNFVCWFFLFFYIYIYLRKDILYCKYSIVFLYAATRLVLRSIWHLTRRDKKNHNRYWRLVEILVVALFLSILVLFCFVFCLQRSGHAIEVIET